MNASMQILKKRKYGSDTYKNLAFQLINSLAAVLQTNWENNAHQEFTLIFTKGSIA